MNDISSGFNFSNITKSQNYTPQPNSPLGGVFSKAFDRVSSFLGSVSGFAFPGLSSENAVLLQAQLEAQKQMMLTSLYSNIEKSKHETQMSAIRNIRVG